jgi:chemotaxis protein MotB
VSIRRRRRPVEHVNHERWLISYADFITLLFAFFVTMYSISTVDQKKMEKAVVAFQGAFAEWRPDLGPDGAPLPGVPGRDASLAFGAKYLGGSGALADVRAHLQERLDALGETRVELKLDPRGLVISVSEAASFPVGSAELDPDAQRLFHEIAVTLAALPNAVRVEGHTDDVPIHTSRYASNWELSTARATSVVAYFVQRVGLSPDRLSAAGYAEYHPQVDNDSQQARARNRRVDVVVLNPQTRDREEPSAGPRLGR